MTTANCPPHDYKRVDTYKDSSIHVRECQRCGHAQIRDFRLDDIEDNWHDVPGRTYGVGESGTLRSN